MVGACQERRKRREGSTIGFCFNDRGMRLLRETLPACSATVRSPMMWPRQTWRRS
jgi:hypothetical protein